MQKILKIARVLNSLSLIASCISGVALWVLCLLTFGLALALNFSYVNFLDITKRQTCTH